MAYVPARAIGLVISIFCAFSITRAPVNLLDMEHPRLTQRLCDEPKSESGHHQGWNVKQCGGTALGDSPPSKIRKPLAWGTRGEPKVEAKAVISRYLTRLEGQPRTQAKPVGRIESVIQLGPRGEH